MPGFDYVEPFYAGFCWGAGKAVVEERFYGCCFGGGWVFGNEADESTWRLLVKCDLERENIGVPR